MKSNKDIDTNNAKEKLGFLFGTDSNVICIHSKSKNIVKCFIFLSMNLNVKFAHLKPTYAVGNTSLVTIPKQNLFLKTIQLNLNFFDLLLAFR